MEEYITVLDLIERDSGGIQAMLEAHEGSVPNQVQQMYELVRYVVALTRISTTLCGLRGRSPQIEDDGNVAFPITIVRDAVEHYAVYLGG